MATERPAKRLRLLGGMQVDQQRPKRVRRRQTAARVAARAVGQRAALQHKRAPNARRASASGRARRERGSRADAHTSPPRGRPNFAANQLKNHAQIFIKTLTGRKQAMTFEPTDEVLQIKRQLQEKEGIQVDQIRLIYSGKQLADDKPLEFYNIQAGGTIHMVLQLRGGGGAP